MQIGTSTLQEIDKFTENWPRYPEKAARALRTAFILLGPCELHEVEHFGQWQEGSRIHLTSTT